MRNVDRAARWKRCLEFMQATGSLPEAMMLAKSKGFSAPASAWLTALGHRLGDKPRRVAPKRSPR